MIENIFMIAFFALLLVNLAAEASKQVKLRWISKPLLMPMLILYYWIGAPAANFSILVVLALFFGMLGDIFMMFEDENKWFLVGIISFFIGHIFYIIFFVQEILNNGSILDFPLWGLLLLLPSFLFGGWGLLKIKDKMGSMQLPCSLYSGILLIMHIIATLRFSVLYSGPFWFVLIGSLLFVVSDTILSVNHFDKKIPYGMVIIMLTYGLGQFFIAHGLLLTSLLR